ncbi:MAG: hypothetical protein LZF60_380222 [Nitrospira sp.]|nr:MAG: hypothetical protein LZF60_380222 [Nitrospira sp.]
MRAEVHRAEAETADAQTGAAEVNVLHGASLLENQDTGF